MKSHWKKLGSQIIFKHPRLTLAEDDVELPDGTKTKYLQYVGLKSYVTILAHKDDKILLIHEYSYPHDEWLWQFPEGDMEDGESPIQAARRELQEEADFDAGELIELGLNYDHHRRTNRKDHIFIANNLTKVSGVQGDTEEQGIEIEWFTVDEISTMVAEGKILQKNALAAWALFLTKHR